MTLTAPAHSLDVESVIRELETDPARGLEPDVATVSVGALAEGRVSTQIEGRRGAAPDPEVWEA